jgi:hypothetical protein
MTQWIFNPELLGLANGTALSNSQVTDAAGGWQLTAVLSSGGTITAQDDELVHVGNAGTARLDGTITVPAGGGMGFAWLARIIAWPTGSANRLIELRHSTNFGLRVEQNTNGTIVLLNAANSAIWTSPSAIPVGTEVRIQVTVDPATSTTGSVALKLYVTNPRSSTTPDSGMSYTSSTFDAGTTDLTIIRFGRVSSTAGSTATVRTIWAIAQDSTADIAPLAGPPTLSFTTADKFVVDARGSGSGGGGALAFSMAYSSGQNNASSILEPVEGLFLVPHGTATSVYTVTVSETTGTDSDTVTVPAAGSGADEGLEYLVYDATLGWV